MAKSWKNLTLDEAVERARDTTRQALHIAIRRHELRGCTEVAEQLKEVRKILKRERRVTKVGEEAVAAYEAKKARKLSKLDK